MKPDAENEAQETIQREDQGFVTLLTLPPSDAPVNGRRLKLKLAELFTEERWHIVVDMGQVAHIASTFLGTILGATITLRPRGGGIKFVGLQPSVTSVFRVTRMSRLFEVLVDRDDAVRSFGPTPPPAPGPEKLL